MITGLCFYLMVGLLWAMWMDKQAPCPSIKSGIVAAVAWPIVMAVMYSRFKRGED